MESGAEHPMLWHRAGQSLSRTWEPLAPPPLTRLEESCRLVMGEASCGQELGCGGGSRLLAPTSQ